ncbi:MAG: AlwI family type II restriction endonuclease, partial [archaeon]
FNQLADKYYRPDINLNKVSSHLTTMDALFRFLEYTSLFIQSGRADYTTISFRKIAKEKINLLLNEYEFVFNENWDSLSFFDVFGDPYTYPLPWDLEDKLYRITLSDLKEIKDRVNRHDIEEDNKFLVEIENLLNKLKQNKDDTEKLHRISDKVRDLTVSVNEDIYINITSKKDEKRLEILEKFSDIIEEKSTETSLALWFENVTWKSLIALNGTHFVKRNFKIEPDLSPRFFAPGMGNTPDVELYNNDFIIIAEVSLTTGTQQWKAEGGSVVDHINSFLKVKIGNNGEQKGNVVKGDKRELIGLFIAKSINNRIMWLFHALNNNSWLNQAIPIIPLKLEDYLKIIKKLYTDDIKAIYFEKFLWTLHREAKACDTVDEWQKSIAKRLNNFIDEPNTYINFNF